MTPDEVQQSRLRVNRMEGEILKALMKCPDSTNAEVLLALSRTTMGIIDGELEYERNGKKETEQEAVRSDPEDV